MRGDFLVRDASHDVTLQDGGDDAPEDEISVEVPMALAGDATGRRLSHPRYMTSMSAS